MWRQSYKHANGNGMVSQLLTHIYLASRMKSGVIRVQVESEHNTIEGGPRQSSRVQTTIIFDGEIDFK